MTAIIARLRSFYGQNPTPAEVRSGTRWLWRAFLGSALVPFLIPETDPGPAASVLAPLVGIGGSIPLVQTLAAHSAHPQALSASFGLQILLLPFWIHFYATRAQGATLRPDGFRKLRWRALFAVALFAAVAASLLFGDVSPGAFSRRGYAGALLRLVSGFRIGMGIGSHVFVFMLAMTVHVVVLSVVCRFPDDPERPLEHRSRR